MKLWDKGQSTDKKIEAFTVGNDRELDLVLAYYDVKASMAHAKMLARVGLISRKEGDALLEELKAIENSIEKGEFTIEEGFEDMHSKIEYLLTQKLGDTGKKIHTARSRNDQVLVAMQLYLKDEIKSIETAVSELFTLLITLAETHKSVLIPGYTHLQIAMPSSFGLWFSCYAESLIDDIHLLKAARKITDQNPLGSAAGYGSSFNIDRSYTTELMEFETMKYNVVAAQMGRGKVEKSLAFAMASLGGTLSKLAMDCCLYMSQNFDFISFPDQLTTGSSIMPHKKNPDVFELIRAKCNVLQSLPNTLIMLTNNLPSGYHRDLQLLKENILPAIETLKSCLEITTFSMAQVEVSQDILNDSKYDYLFSVENLNALVKEGMPFRDAYKKLGKDIASGSYQPNKKLEHTHEGSIGNLCLGEITRKMEQALKG
ncbi:argininosuccinate lyase [Lentiprolixibacter aurantiacus]|uniref:Argininosuccinate lyase n=1 Tax=Lentiprolixibacter aurantiacus TaxID=2993939 RepID=A0AAE3SM35_9FLAO|nr:argininosuccinate lyase [Lentiprolixibacter aurantiacus]MCX2718154.1 argininosuccinate lyase [Lentiprolixibacter aurantiacus]